MDVLNIILPIVYIVVGCALVWFLVELALTVHKTKKIVVDVKKQIDPTLANVEKITTDIQPMMDHVQLTIDAANLEIMRVDEILADVTTITNTASKAVDAVDTVTSAPIELVNSIAGKIRSRFGGKDASSESVQLGENKAVANGELPPKSAISNFVDATGDAIDNVAEKIVQDADRDTGNPVPASVPDSTSSEHAAVSGQTDKS